MRKYLAALVALTLVVGGAGAIAISTAAPASACRTYAC